jgi:hypothetical protein
MYPLLGWEQLFLINGAMTQWRNGAIAERVIEGLDGVIALEGTEQTHKNFRYSNS